MKQELIIYLPYVMSGITLYMTFMAGNKHRYSWAIGLVNQGFWFSWIVMSQNWGLMPMCIGLTWVYLRNHLKWNKPQAVAQETFSYTDTVVSLFKDLPKIGDPKKLYYCSDTGLLYRWTKECYIRVLG